MTGPIDDLGPTSHDHDPRDCPKCRARMSKSSYRGVTVDQCPQCRGLWFDLFELEELRKLQGSEQIDGVDPQGSGDHVPANELQCPDDHQPLVRVTDARQPHIRYEKCSICYGVFLDAGEFRDFKDFTPQEFLAGVFSRFRA